MPKLCINLSMTWSQKPLIFKRAYLSNGVYCILIMTNFPYKLYFNGNVGIVDDGLTVNDEPIDKHKSDFDDYVIERFN